MDWRFSMNKDYRQLKTIFNTALLTIATATFLIVIAGKFIGFLPIRSQQLLSGWVIIIVIGVAILNWRFCLLHLSNLATKIDQFDKWCFDNSTFCFVIGLFAGFMCIPIGMQILLNLNSFYLTVVLGACFFVCLMMTVLMITAWEKKFGPM